MAFIKIHGVSQLYTAMRVDLLCIATNRTNSVLRRSFSSMKRHFPFRYSHLIFAGQIIKFSNRYSLLHLHHPFAVHLFTRTNSLQVLTAFLSSNIMLVFIFLLLCFKPIAIPAQTPALPLPDSERKALSEIADQLGKKGWNLRLNPCDGDPSWNTPAQDGWPIYQNSVLCNCTYSDGFCHVENISLTAQDLAGVLPPSLAKLPFLKKIDLTRNYLSGTIPPEWASIKVQIMSVAINRLSGPIPTYLGNITTLRILSLENNMFNGTVPRELGNLVNLERFILSANNLTGDLPIELNNMTGLTQLRLSRNNFTGKLPSFQAWTNLQSLEIEASGFEGPIPSSISALTNLTELRISYLNGGDSEFPMVKNMTSLTKLMLRSCNLIGKIPDYVGSMTPLRTLDLSFNNLEGEIPSLGLSNMEVMLLTNNSLTGPVPVWMQNRDPRTQIDISYNNFSESSVPSTCRETFNVFKTFSEWNHAEKCLSPCSKDWYNFHINCGGPKVVIGETTYDDDQNSAGSTKFAHPYENWVTSSTGDFWDVNRTISDYTANNVSVIKGNETELYTTARVSPLSLTYFGRCLANGNYTITLHFAEIIIRDNRSFESLGRRFFDVYIQGVRVLKDLDIKSAAQGVDTPIKLKFNAPVTDKTLEVRFYYTGKGTTAAPVRGNYGSLVSAISVESDFDPPNHKKKTLTIAVSVAASLVAILIVLGIAWRKRYLKSRISKEQELIGLDLKTGFFTFRQIKAATDNFSAANKLGEGGFGAVYKGTLLDGTIIAVKQLSSKSKQGNREFVNEVGMISGLQHPNVVRLHGCCIEGNQLLLVYEYVENNSLARALFGSQESRLQIDWPTRQRICVGIAKGLAFLHEESALKIVHRDIKAANVLLDKNLNPKISDFGLAKLDEEDNTHISSRVAGTMGYMAPEYALWGYLTYKVDVYSFGIVALEIVAGKNNMKFRPNESYVCLLDWALVVQKKGSLLELVDSQLGSDFNKEEAIRMIKVALVCTNPSPALRPTMSAVVRMLEGEADVNDLSSDATMYGDDLHFQSLREKYDEMQSSNARTGDVPSSSSF
ncbi:PREDICTED: probable LRR receptor-like serine/threonine-protein kinase At1g07650 isoform X2 [Ipomoea nil]|uniref:probable LRR receptor-like serine/threonine-protein kinase At1g07650 isoform X2 n=1 Tax=Ipomoea nil TaxID=35883 RepID=UPI000901A128|nr:PREDICTED: probable LRR receptor-like serine/threonine-protein kinase At1g07650 isoform X2 [Ipomoea nil]